MTPHDSTSSQESILFTDEERGYYRKPKTARLIVDLSLPWLQAILGCAIFIAYPSFWSWLIAVFIIAGAQHGLSLISHEAAHRLICPQDKRKNDLIATYLFAAPALLPFNVYRQRHLIHHRLVSQPGDTKSFYLRDLRGGRFSAEILKSLSGIDYLIQAFEALRAGKDEGYNQFDANLRRDKISIVTVHLVLFFAFTIFDPFHFGVPTYYFILWLWPMVTVSFLFGKLRSIVEHQPPRTGSEEVPETPYFLNTSGPLLRTVNATFMERLFLSKINFHYHGEHHLWPWISYQYLPEINARIWKGNEHKNSLLLNGNLMVFDRSYCSVLRDIMHGK